MSDKPRYLTPNFQLTEFVRPSDPMPDESILQNLQQLANRLQVIRDLVGRPVLINSGYRTPEHNRAVGGASASQHLQGKAADIIIPGMPASQVQQMLKNWSGGLGCYQHYTHVDIRPTRARWGDAYQA